MLIVLTVVNKAGHTHILTQIITIDNFGGAESFVFNCGLGYSVYVRGLLVT